MTLPIALSVPHAGVRIPDEAASYCQLTHEQIVADGDEGAAEIYNLQDEVAELVTTDVARAIVDVNRASDDRRPDGVIKTTTIWNESIYRQPLPEELIEELLEKYYRPYHARLDDLSQQGLMLAVDCHTMAAEAPPISKEFGEKRPEVCLGDAQGSSLPKGWTEVLLNAFSEAFAGFQVTLNQPFAGGFITRKHGRQMPWVQLEISRSDFLSRGEIRTRILDALRVACEKLG